jgi:MscS family membrane protein
MRRFFIASLVLALTALYLPSAAREQPTLKQVIEQKTSPEKPANQKMDQKKAEPDARPAPDPSSHGSPEAAVRQFMEDAQKGEFQAAANFLDLRDIPPRERSSLGGQLAFELSVVFEQALLIDYDLLSQEPGGNLKDGLPAGRDRVGHIKLPNRSVDISLRRIKGSDGAYQWKFSRSTVAAIPLLYENFGYGNLAEIISQWLPAGRFLGMYLWQWVALALIIVFSWGLAVLITGLIKKLLLSRDTGLRRQIALSLTGPVRLLLLVAIGRQCIDIMGPSVLLQAVLHGQTLLLVAVAWTAIRTIDLATKRLTLHLNLKGQSQSTVLLRPAATIAKVLLLLTATVLWLDNVGFRVTTIIASLGVGGIAVALAAQDALKNFIGSIAVLLDKPFKVGERVSVQGHDGMVEEIGLRSTRLRLLTGSQAVIPNETMARVDIENIGRRPHIRRRSNIGIAYDTPREKVATAVEIIEEILENHQGMHPDFPPRVAFTEFNEYSLNILMVYWFRPPDFWEFNAFSQQVNLEIMRRFEEEGIHFAYPTQTTYLASDPERPLEFEIKGHSPDKGPE